MTYFKYERIMSKLERRSRRLFLAGIVLLALLAGSNLLWIHRFFWLRV